MAQPAADGGERAIAGTRARPGAGERAGGALGRFSRAVPRPAWDGPDQHAAGPSTVNRGPAAFGESPVLPGPGGDGTQVGGYPRAGPRHAASFPGRHSGEQLFHGMNEFLDA